MWKNEWVCCALKSSKPDQIRSSRLLLYIALISYCDTVWNCNIACFVCFNIMVRYYILLRSISWDKLCLTHRINTVIKTLNCPLMSFPVRRRLTQTVYYKLNVPSWFACPCKCYCCRDWRLHGTAHLISATLCMIQYSIINFYFHFENLTNIRFHVFSIM